MKTVVCAAQFAPELVNFDAGVKKAVRIIDDAAKEGAQLVVFPEAWILGYTYWASIGTRDPVFHWFLKKLRQETGPVDDERLRPIADAAARGRIAVSIGIHERDGATLYLTQLLFGPDGTLANAHRKLVPTNTERLIWGCGDGSDMKAHDFGFGKINGLMCFEHQMTLARYALASTGEQIHCAAWPGHGFITPVIDASNRQLAHENGCFVISAREVMSAELLPKDAPGDGGDPDRWSGVGGSSIIAPTATYIAEPVHNDERLIVGELDFSLIEQVKYHFDGVGHYARPDVFQLKWDDRPKPPCVHADG